MLLDRRAFISFLSSFDMEVQCAISSSVLPQPMQTLSSTLQMFTQGDANSITVSLVSNVHTYQR